jgi:LemA protein
VTLVYISLAALAGVVVWMILAYNGLVEARKLAEVEDEIQAARRIYNANAQDYNTRITVFPNNLLAGPMSFHSREFLEIELAAKRVAPRVAV